MQKGIIRFESPKYYDLYMTCHAHGWKNLAPFQWCNESKTLAFPIFLSGNSVNVEVCQERAAIKTILLSGKELNESELSQCRKAIIRTLGLDTDTSGLLLIAEQIGPEYAHLIRKGAGRLLRAPTLWEDAAKTLFTTNCSWALTRKMCKSVCSERFSTRTPSGSYPFPPPQKIAEYSPEKIQTLMPVGYRAEFLIGLSKRFCVDPNLNDLELNGFGYRKADATVRSLKGFGDYAVAHILVLTGHFDKIPVDSVVVSYLKNNYRVRKPNSFIKRHYRKWGKYQWWGLKLEKMLKRQNWLGD